MENATEKVKRVAGRFTSLASDGKIEDAVAYYEREAVFCDCPSPLQASEKGLRTPPMNELFKGVKD